MTLPPVDFSDAGCGSAPDSNEGYKGTKAQRGEDVVEGEVQGERRTRVPERGAANTTTGSDVQAAWPVDGEKSHDMTAPARLHREGRGARVAARGSTTSSKFAVSTRPRPRPVYVPVPVRVRDHVNARGLVLAPGHARREGHGERLS